MPKNDKLRSKIIVSFKWKTLEQIVSIGVPFVFGIILAIISPAFFGMPIEFTAGYMYIILSGFAFSFSLLISKKYLNNVPVPLLAVFRVLLGE